MALIVNLLRDLETKFSLPLASSSAIHQFDPPYNIIFLLGTDRSLSVILTV
jgi:hypothetical protein